jgi:hypothetical protein
MDFFLNNNTASSRSGYEYEEDLKSCSDSPAQPESCVLLHGNAKELSNVSLLLIAISSKAIAILRNVLPSSSRPAGVFLYSGGTGKKVRKYFSYVTDVSATIPTRLR